MGNLPGYGGGSSDQGAGYWKPKPPAAPGYTPSGYSMWGPTNGPTSGFSAQPGATVGYQTQAKPKAKGTLSGPTNVNQIYGRFQNDPNRGYFQPRQKSYTEELYESGNQGLGKYYQQARDEGMNALQDRMASMGVLGSGATALAMGNLDAKYGAQYGRDMGNLAQAADTAGSNRVSDYWGGWKNEMDLGDKADTSLERRERLPLQDKMGLATQMAPMFERFSSATADEQKQIWDNVIQSIVAGGTVDSQAAAQQAEDMFRMYGIGIRAADMMNRPGSTAATPNLLDPFKKT